MPSTIDSLIRWKHPNCERYAARSRRLIRRRRSPRLRLRGGTERHSAGWLRPGATTGRGEIFDAQPPAVSAALSRGWRSNRCGYACRVPWGRILGRGFDSRRLHHSSSATAEKKGVIRKAPRPSPVLSADFRQMARDFRRPLRTNRDSRDASPAGAAERPGARRLGAGGAGIRRGTSRRGTAKRRIRRRARLPTRRRPAGGRTCREPSRRRPDRWTAAARPGGSSGSRRRGGTG